MHDPVVALLALRFAFNGYGLHSPGGFKLGAAVLVEVFFTGVFVFIIASTSRLSMPAGLTGITVGLTLTVIHLISAPSTTPR